MQNHTKKAMSEKQSKNPKAIAAPNADDYPVVVWWSEEDSAFLAQVPALEGVLTHGVSRRQALDNAREAAELWLEVAVGHGDHIPPPPKGMSGKLLLRLPKTLHESIARKAELDGVSINQWAVMALARQEGRAE